MKMKKNGRGQILRSLVLVTQLGINMMVPVFMCVALGLFLDRTFGWYTVLPLLVLGFLAGAKNVWRMVKQVSGGEEQQDG